MMIIVRSRAAGSEIEQSRANKRYNLLLLLVAGLGGLLYGIDLGIIGGAYPYLEATSHLTASQLSDIVAAVLLGSVLSTLSAGLLADSIGRKPLMTLSGVMFVISIPVIALSGGYASLFMGRLLQGVSAGLIGIVVPLYLAECLVASARGRGTAVFQWMLTLGIVAAAIVGVYYSYQVEAVARSANADAVFHFKDQAWRRIFWVSLPPGVLFALGSLFVGESPRWLYRRGFRVKAFAALQRSRTLGETALEIKEMEDTNSRASSMSEKTKESLLRRKYVIPFILTCVILFCNTATGINSIIGYNAGILLQSGLSDLGAHWGYVIFTCVNFLMTGLGTMLVDIKGRKFLLAGGTAGIILSLVGVGALFLRTEQRSIDCRDQVQAMVGVGQDLSLHFDRNEAATLLAKQGYSRSDIDSGRASLSIIYAYGDFTGATSFARSDDPAGAPLTIRRVDCIPANRVEALFKNPFANLEAARNAPLEIKRAIVATVPSSSHGWLVAAGLYLFVAFFAAGPGVCVWLALSELMPTRIRSNGMSIALVINQLVSTTFAAIFLPFVAQHGYSSIFFLFSGFTVIYFIAAVFFLPETKGKTLEEIEAHFEGRRAQV